MSDNALFAGATGMANEQTNLDIIAHNIANMNSTAFKESTAEFADLMYQNLRSFGADSGTGDVTPTGIQVGQGSQLVSTTKIFSQGQIQRTDNDLDMAIEGDGFLEVLTPDGETAYTRAGDLKITGDGKFVTNTGYILQSGFQDVPTGAKISMAPNGQITARNASGDQTFRISLVRFMNPSGLESLGDNLYRKTPASGAAETGSPGESGFGLIRQRHLEKSNVEAVSSMVKMIIAQRSFEMNSKSIKTAEDMMETAAHIKR